MKEFEELGFKGFWAELRLHDSLIRLIELRLEEVERRILLLEARARMSSMEATT